MLTHVFITARSLTCCARTSPAKRRTTRLRLAEPPHALSRAARGLGDPSPTQWKTPPLQALCVEVSDARARLATLSSAWSWIPPCHMWSTFARRWERLVVGVFAPKVCTAVCVLHLSSGFALLARLTAIVHSSALDRRVTASASGLQSRRSSV